MSQVAKYIKKVKILLLIVNSELKGNLMSLCACLKDQDAYLNVDIYLCIAHVIGIEVHLPSDKTNIHLARQSAYR